MDDVPPGVRAQAGAYTDLNPRWSHDGRRIAFLRATPDRRLQLHVIDEDLTRPLALLEPELVCPDRPYSSTLRRYASPDTVAWSPNDRQIAFARIEWFTFEDGQRLPGTGLWSLDTYSGRVRPLALHPERYERAYYYYHAPQWSPDGRYLAFVGEGINGQRALLIHPIFGQKPQEVSARFDNYEDSDWPAWEPRRRAQTGQPLLTFRQGVQRVPAMPTTDTLRFCCPGSPAKEDSGELWRMTTRQYETLVSGPPALPILGGMKPVQTRTPPKVGGPGGPVKQPFGVAPRIGHPVWSPDGQWLAFSLTPDANDFTRYELWVARRDGEEARRVSPADGRGYFAPVWIGRRRLGALSPRGEDFEAVTVHLTTGRKRTLGIIESADCDWSPDRSLIVYAGRATGTPPTTLRMLETGLRGGRG